MGIFFCSSVLYIVAFVSCSCCSSLGLNHLRVPIYASTDHTINSTPKNTRKNIKKNNLLEDFIDDIDDAIDYDGCGEHDEKSKEN